MNASDSVAHDTDSSPQAIRHAEIDPRPRRTLIAQVLAGMVGLQLALPVYAMAIGEPRQVSRLFEPLRVDIPIEANASNDTLRVRLIMKTEDDAATSAESPGLRQQLITDATGQRFLRITTATAIREPVMTLHVDLSDGGIQVRRDLTLLFDPPQGDAPSAALAVREVPQAIVPAVVAAESTSDRSSVASEPSEATVAAVKPSHRAAATRLAAVAPTTTVAKISKLASVPAGWRITRPARPGESLDEIATRVRPSSETPVASMAMLLRWLNPRAFDPHSGGLRVGATMRFPGRDEIGEQLAAFMPGGAQPVAVASAATLAPAAVASVSVASVSAIPVSHGLYFDDRLSSASMQIIATLASGAVAVASAAPLPATTDAAAIVPAGTGTPTVAVAPVFAARPEESRSPADAPSIAAVATLPIPTIFPAWMIATALGLSGGMLWLFGRLLRNTPEPSFAAQRSRHAFARSAIAAPALVDQWMQRAESPAVAVLLPKTETVREELKAPMSHVEDERVESVARSPEPTLDAEWNPEHFDLSRVDLDDAASENDGTLGDRHEQAGDAPSAMTGRHANEGRS